MRLPTLLWPALLLGLALPAQQTQPDEGGAFAIRPDKIYTGNGKALTNAYLVVRDGKVVRVTPNKPTGVTIIEAAGKTVMPGIVAADTELTRHSDNRYNVNPDFVALEGFDFDRKRPRALAGGVTTVYLSPGRQRLVTGQGSVVKLAGDGLFDRVVAEHASLRLTMGAEAASAPAVFEPTVTPTSDNPLKPARRQYPSSRLSQLTELRRIFRTAQTTKEERIGTGAAENRYSPQPLRDAASGKLRLRIAAKEVADLRNAVRFAKQLGTQLVLENPYAVKQLLELGITNDAMVVCRIPVRPGQVNAGGENRSDERTKNRPENAILAHKAGLKVAIVPASDQDLPDYLLIAGMAVRMGMTPAAALRSITAEAAEVLGVQERIGSLEPGKDADFLILSGDPFEIGTMVEETFVNGKRAWKRSTKTELLVVKAKRIITCEGTAIDNGSIIVQKGRIKGVGRDLAVPYGAKVIDMGDSVIVPGFIDAYCHAGLSGDNTGIPRGAADQRLTDVIRTDDKVLGNVAAAGMTTLLVSGTDSGLVSGRVAAIKSAGKDRKSMVVKDIAAIRFVHDNIAENGIRALEGQINRGRAYLKKWRDYEKALAAWKSGKAKAKPKPTPAKKEVKPTPGKGSDPITGGWTVAPSGPAPNGRRFPFQFVMDLKLAGTKVTGTFGLLIALPGRPPRAMAKQAIDEGKFENGKLMIKAKIAMGRAPTPVQLDAKVSGETMDGTIELTSPRGKQKFPVKGRRGGAPKVAAAPVTNTVRKKKSDKPKKPTVNEAMEPLRALLEKRAVAVIRSTRAPAIEQVVAWFEKQKLPYVLHGIRDAVDTPEILGDAKPGVLLQPGVVTRKKGRIINAAAKMSDAGQPVALVSAATDGVRYLPLHAAHAIRYGMDPEEALKALTIYPARMFQIADRVGSLKRGKDADFVVYSGSPFEMTSRIQMVVINGRVVVDNREKAEAQR